MSKEQHDYLLRAKDEQVAPLTRWQLYRLRGRDILTLKAQLKLEWVVSYHTVFEKNAKETAIHFGISRKTFHKWLGRFDERNLSSLEEGSRVPFHTRKRQISFLQRKRITTLRKDHMKWGKMKLQKRYKAEYGIYISSWKIQKVIEEGKLYSNKAEQVTQEQRRKQARKDQKRRIHTFEKKQEINYLWHVDTVVCTLSHGGYRYLLTAIDEVSKLAYARLYTTHSSKQAADFLRRLHYVTEGEIINLHHDNGSEFQKDFEQACKELSLPQWYSRPHTPKDNPVLERFNRTIQEEFVDIVAIGLEDVFVFNQKLLEWLIEYNSVRPHQTLDYLTPLEYIDQYSSVLPMSSSFTSI